MNKLKSSNRNKARPRKLRKQEKIQEKSTQDRQTTGNSDYMETEVIRHKDEKKTEEKEAEEIQRRSERKKRKASRKVFSAHFSNVQRYNFRGR